jgi:hypothetical protein
MNTKVHIMQQEQDPLNLRSLPLVSPPSDGWPAIEAALRERHSRRPLLKLAAGALAAAASVTLVLSLVLFRPATVPGGDTAVVQEPIAQAEKTAAADAGGRNNVETLIALSQRLETSLRHFRSEVGVMPTSSLIYQVELEDLVAQVDEELSMRSGSTELWSQRVNLLLDFAQLYRNELRRDYHQMASL